MTTASAYTAVIRQDGSLWIGWVEEVPGVNAQEESREALLESLREILREALEFNRQDALEAAGPGAEELALVLWSVEICFATSAAIVVKSWGKVVTIHGDGTHLEIFVVRFRAILKSRNCLYRRSAKILVFHRHDIRSRWFIQR
jgi:predicted RNase H-like HicB family nuclease